MAAKYCLLPFVSGFIVFSPGFQSTGHASSGLSCTYCTAWKDQYMGIVKIYLKEIDGQKIVGKVQLDI
jgi:hypothetical protein